MDKQNAIKSLNSMVVKVQTEHGKDSMDDIVFQTVVDIIKNQLTDDIENNNLKMKIANKFFLKAML